MARIKYKLPEGATKFTEGPDGRTLVVTPGPGIDEGGGR